MRCVRPIMCRSADYVTSGSAVSNGEQNVDSGNIEGAGKSQPLSEGCDMDQVHKLVRNLIGLTREQDLESIKEL